jgi:hypothetical protein
MTRLTALEYVFASALALGGVVAACRATSPEAPPLAPSPETAPGSPSPVPRGPISPEDPTTPGPNFPPEDAGAPLPTPGPTPKEPSPISAREMPIPDLRSERYQLVDAGMVDAAKPADAMPADSMIYDARPQPDATLLPPFDAAAPNP